MGLFGKKPLDADKIIAKAVQAHPHAHDFQFHVNTATFKTGKDYLDLHVCEVSVYGDTCVTHRAIRRDCSRNLAEVLAMPENGLL
ncbi:hypothetical protein [Streptomyces niveus]|uniref:Uncharacterized protein n=1 Tax=Streptomyces niveus TaxID=193462 RepID=A0A1U9R1J5_STRNV|nr:hypothetical protein [Streptomyces niveus]AQU70093.1 hypothetical protein BBN63_31865 [Streptomyces niveus]